MIENNITKSSQYSSTQHETTEACASGATCPGTSTSAASCLQSISISDVSCTAVNERNHVMPEDPVISSNTSSPVPVSSQHGADTVSSGNTASTPNKQNPSRSATPRKSSAFHTPPRKVLFRKRRATPETWLKNQRKHLRLGGMEYVNQQGKTMKGKSVKAVDCSKCRYKCTQKIPEEARHSIFKAFRSLSSYERQKDFVCSNTDEKKTRTYLDDSERKVEKKRQVYRAFNLQWEGTRHLVCKKFFMKTLDIGESYISHALQHKSQGTFGSTERRGRHKPHNKTASDRLTKVREHIESFPKMDAHYTRKDTNRQFLGPELNIKKMYELYKERCAADNKEPVSSSLYRNVFNKEYNFSFHVPKKDQCSLCQQYYRERDTGCLTEQLTKDFNEHQARKIRAREAKIKDKALALTESSVFVGTFDLEAVLYTPCSLVSEIFYMRKLNCYNFTVHDAVHKSGTCFLWSEVDAQRGSCEIASCLQIQLKAMPPNINHVILYSDTCTGQNRNQYVAASLLHAVTTTDHIDVIDHKFLEPGHTQMECDAIHSSIEFAKKKTSIFVPSQWDTVIRMARRKDPYLVIPIKHTDVMDFKKLAHQRLKNTKVDTDGGRVNWLNVRWLRFMKTSPDSIYFKTEHNDEQFREIKVTAGSRRGRPLNTTNSLTCRYTGKQEISHAKKKDLLSLCRSGIIPSEYHEYYKALPTGNRPDCLPVPDAMEEDYDTDIA
ncbi:uncharacterized protein LOC125374054 [Haliotis rufescens]|uniref:uncharacterized protein LOC125374054 n=1 Tax=Haliotis rufescens TaxID=6454 RepID=UPI00201ECAAB|nr:uncharacterized protein LOC125374054 [Haliotis rufescens]